LSSSGFGSSVAKARAASESIMRLTQRRWIGSKGVYFVMADPTKTRIRATTLIVS